MDMSPEEQELQTKFEEIVRDLLDRGIPIYYTEDGNEEGLIIKEHPDGRREFVTFDFKQRAEVIRGPAPSKRIGKRLRMREFGYESSRLEGMPLSDKEKDEMRELVRAGKTGDEIVSEIRKSMGLPDDRED